MNILKKYIYSFSFLLVLSFFPFLKASVQKEEEVEVKIHNIGQGNFVTLKVKKENKKKPSCMLIDAGTNSLENEILYYRGQTPVKNKNVTLEVPHSITKVPDFKLIINKTKGMNEKKSSEAKNKKEDAETEIENHKTRLIKNMRAMFGAETSESNIHLKTVIITHPDVDHYNWIFKIFWHEKDKIDYFIFGGLPQVYASKKVDKKDIFTSWIENKIAQGSKVFFPAIQCKAIQSLDEVIRKEKEFFYAPPSYSPIEGDWPPETVRKLKEAVNFGANVKISFLSINPTHFLDHNNKVIRMSLPSDNNSDSLVLKVAYGKSSITLTGDATGVTFTRIKSNYENCLQYLCTNSYLAAHHGSYANEANDLKFLHLFNPNNILISNGHNKGHPDAQAYENFKQLNSLKMVTRHKVLVGKSPDFKLGSLHETSRAIFSTLNSGTLTVKLHQNGKFDLLTIQDGKIEVYDKEDSEKDVSEEVEIQEDEGKVVLSPVKFSKIKETKFPKTVEKNLKYKKSNSKININYEIDQETETPVASPNYKIKIKREESLEKSEKEDSKSTSESDEKKTPKKNKKRKKSESPVKSKKKRKKN